MIFSIVKFEFSGTKTSFLFVFFFMQVKQSWYCKRNCKKSVQGCKVMLA